MTRWMQRFGSGLLGVLFALLVASCGGGAATQSGADGPAPVRSEAAPDDRSGGASQGRSDEPALEGAGSTSHREGSSSPPAEAEIPASSQPATEGTAPTTTATPEPAPMTGPTPAAQAGQPPSAAGTDATVEAGTPARADADRANVAGEAPARLGRDASADRAIPEASEGARAAGVTDVDPPPARGIVMGSVRIVGDDAREITPENVIINLVPLEGQRPAARPESRTYVIDMRDKEFRPGALHVRPGERVRFRNSDSFKHNVFSRSGDNAFDLGTYGPGAQPGTTFESTGIVKVYCNVHAAMAAFVQVSESPWGAVTGDDGLFLIEEVPPGRYRLEAWNIRADDARELVVVAGDRQMVRVTLDATGYVDTGHLNKFGQPYEDPVDLGGGFEYF